ncbi:MAG: bifunctional 4-hydroxy-2-oxoglutarate aldolase/2-dehydro-3-deoxy-phosphogluconate aldolase [Caldilineaceae bacterium]|nr:bifunctional 4-hydroxy-2-oxoglutarate aldolase/2-dehydro-3-deoxy-phosphogluconate aldolase [Caldilineaceae bacterium]MDE0338701.1 bifunctional 4-hydroxy-2-oxoglutarate aldolase/2-dehydro-3-deoxy-phosphogluconate aldolase [Caldilineaceae bacterium]
MSNAQNTVQVIEKGGVVPVVRLPDLAGAAELAQALLDGGVTAVELTMTSPGALEALSLLRERVPAFAQGAAALGMGSVLNRNMAAAAIARGAQFVVAPTLDLPTVAYCAGLKVPVMPGAFTPSEVQNAWQAGAAVVKVFPATKLGPGYFTDILAPLPHLKLMPTGGVGLDNAGEFVRAGAVAVGVGSALVRKDWIADGSWQAVTEQARRFVSAVREARAEK